MDRYYKHLDGSVIKISLGSRFGKQILYFQPVVQDNSPVGRKVILKNIEDSILDSFFVKIQDTYLVRTGNTQYYLHDYSESKTNETTGSHLYRFQPTGDQLQKINADIERWERHQARLRFEKPPIG